MIDAGELKKGMTIELDGQLFQVLDYQHIKMGRGSAQLRLKLRNIRAGHTTERSFQASEKFIKAFVERREVQYLYNDGDIYHFMDSETYEQTAVDKNQIGDALGYLKESLTLDLLTYKGETIGIEIPLSVDLKVVDTGPAFKGNTVSAGTKHAVMETGITIQVPLFINNGDVLKIDTRTGAYIERKN
jgi:elongation factor P